MARAWLRRSLSRARVGRSRGTAQIRQTVVPAPLVVIGRVGTGPQFLDQTLLEHPADCAVQGAGTEADFALRAHGHILHDRVAVAVAIRQCHQDVEHGRRQGQKYVDIGFTWLGHYVDGHYTVHRYS